MAASVPPSAIDPCALVTRDEASALAGVTFGAGRDETLQSGLRQCIYGYQTLNVFTVQVVQATSEAEAKAEEAAGLAAAKQQISNGLKVTELPGFEDGVDAAVLEGKATISGQTFSASGIYVLKGTTFFDFSDVTVGHDAPSSDALQAQAKTSLTRVP
jgi:hypothetical protein